MPDTIGVKLKRMPNSLKMTVMATPPLAFGCAMGTGNSPPARNVAVSRLPARRFGSARSLARPRWASASMKARKLLDPKSVRIVANRVSDGSELGPIILEIEIHQEVT